MPFWLPLNASSEALRLTRTRHAILGRECHREERRRQKVKEIGSNQSRRWRTRWRRCTSTAATAWASEQRAGAGGIELRSVNSDRWDLFVCERIGGYPSIAFEELSVDLQVPSTFHASIGSA
ncbi:hypothetical protein AXG93_4620s1680 [Marchantia polymorpha subsp. ruderalis]|uniref:Uncharacterized protein n=1 Tax=Marchantia polymorpha subsp. ruderalis TaxID=1480154 RepID=A0A176VY86_MARPO|nr:hypothetical protein AXG93_4620s1680 [Marchantia polymorpha subsp. ruderalis]